MYPEFPSARQKVKRLCGILALRAPRSYCRSKYTDDDDCLARCVRWSLWHIAWVYKENMPINAKLPKFTPLPTQRNDIARGPNDVDSERSSGRSGKSIVGTDAESTSSPKT